MTGLADALDVAERVTAYVTSGHLPAELAADVANVLMAEGSRTPEHDQTVLEAHLAAEQARINAEAVGLPGTDAYRSDPVAYVERCTVEDGVMVFHGRFEGDVNELAVSYDLPAGDPLAEPLRTDVERTVEFSAVTDGDHVDVAAVRRLLAELLDEGFPPAVVWLGQLDTADGDDAVQAAADQIARECGRLFDEALEVVRQVATMLEGTWGPGWADLVHDTTESAAALPRPEPPDVATRPADDAGDCWRCDSATAATDVGLCTRCLADLQDPDTTAPRPILDGPTSVTLEQLDALDAEIGATVSRITEADRRAAHRGRLR